MIMLLMIFHAVLQTVNKSNSVKEYSYLMTLIGALTVPFDVCLDNKLQDFRLY